MNKILIIIFSGLMVLNACQPGKSGYTIVVSENTDSTTTKAALQLQKYWQEVFNKSITIATASEKGKIPVYIGKKFLGENEQQTINGLKDDAFYISVQQDQINLAGKNKQGDLYAVNAFLEEQVGCMKLSDTEDYIPKRKEEVFTPVSKSHEPAFDFRRILFPGSRNSKDYRDWYKLHEINDWGMYVHTFHKLIPPDKYFEEHPEFFSLINGRRLKDAQLCLSNPKVIDLLIENLGKEIAKQPDKQYWSVSQNDAYNYCECSECQKMYKKYGSISGAYIEMANKIALAFPKKQISTLAYQFTRSAPKQIKPLPNVNIMFCSIECNRSQPLEEDPRSDSFVKDMKDWSALTSNIYVWDYVVQFKNYLTPFPNFHVLQPNIKFFNNCGVNLMFQQGSNRNWSDLAELKQYVIAKLLWNPDADVDSLTHLFIERYYGEAAPFIAEYHKLTTSELEKQADTEFLNIYGYPGNYTDSYLTPQLMLKYKELMDKAESSVIGNIELLDRILRTRLPVDFAFVDIAVNNHFPELPATIIENGKKKANPMIIEMLDKMEAYAGQHSNIKINERNFELKDYKIYVLNKLKMISKENLLVDAKISVLTNYSDTYPVGGEKALNDGLFGTLNYSENWLGFHGEDMMVQIDFESVQTISEIDMNFLKAVNSWVFLPEQISIESSIDGKKYKTIKTQINDLSDQNYLVKSIPFNYKFEPFQSKHLRINAKSIKECPEWHRGFGKPSWIFVDEILVN